MLDSSFCSVVGGASLLYLAAVVSAPNFPKIFLSSGFFQIPSFPIPVLALYFVPATWVQPSHSASPRPSSVSRANLVLTRRLMSFLPLSAAVLYCTVLYCTVLYCTPVLMSSSSSSSSSSSPLYCLRKNISFDTLIRRSSRGHNSRKATQPSHCGTCLILLIFIAKKVQPSLPSSTLRSNFVYPRQISRSPRVGRCMS